MAAFQLILSNLSAVFSYMKLRAQTGHNQLLSKRLARKAYCSRPPRMAASLGPRGGGTVEGGQVGMPHANVVLRTPPVFGAPG